MEIKKTKENIQIECLNTIVNYKKGTAAISMGVGKTLIALKYLGILSKWVPNCKFLVVIPKKSMIKTWKDECDKHELSYLIPFIEFTTYRSLTKQNSEKFTAVILDECHNLKYNHDLWLSTFTGRVLGLTGTPPRYKKSEKGEMVAKHCPIVYSYILDDAVEAGILNNYRIIVHGLFMSKEKTFFCKTKNGGFIASEQKNYEFWSTRVYEAKTDAAIAKAKIMRSRMMMNYPSKIEFIRKLSKTISDKCIIFCNTQEQTEQVCSFSYHSGNKESEENLIYFKTGEIDKLACCMSLNEGINIPDLKSSIVMHSYSNDKNFLQRLGRMMRLNPNDVSTIHLLMYQGTIDEIWVKNALSSLDKDKITYILQKP